MPATEIAAAYRALLGRDPTPEEIAAREGLAVPALVQALVRSAEYGAILARMAAGRLTRHVTLTAEAANLTDAYQRQFSDRTLIPTYRHHTGREFRLGLRWAM